MRLLHTADWHVGRTIRGRSRADEHIAVLAEIVAIAQRQNVDVAIVAGDVFDASAPTPEAEQIVYRALLDLAIATKAVIVIAGNHDHPGRLSAVRPLLDLGRVHVAAYPARPEEGGVLERDVAGTKLRVALLPFLSQRAIITAEMLMAESADKHVMHYADRYSQIVHALSAAFANDAVNIVVAHTTVAGARLGGGEREAHTIDDYHVTGSVFPSTAHYVALGHVHRAQQMAGPCPIWYSGSPLQLDFGEGANAPRVLLIDAEPGVPVEVREVRLENGRRLRTLRGTLGSLPADNADDAYLRVILDEPLRAGLSDEVRERLPHVVDVIVARPDDASPRIVPDLATVRRSPRELFREFLTEKKVKDREVSALFDALLEEAGVD